ncbi:hypothetical protein EZJ49_14010 [Bdellovibrio bacteriovorus]|uniref:hypothetical protein n=1 Tax=Bdellovibrio bacteriovorus TaxID=959 RepID=UPI0021D116C1|nr:hypothetical protein [Bdellovibrio bacteriovorus]UXR64177.1 hypothetical protein EZJ49_14010 [Bdellovibrio bacteriovorus]
MDKFLMLEFEKTQLLRAVLDNGFLTLDLETTLCVVDETVDVLERADKSVTTKIVVYHPRLNRVPSPSYLVEGSLQIDSKPKGYFPLNLDFTGDFRLTFTFGPDEFETEGDRIVITTADSELPSGYRKIPQMKW